jgi:hypothetical protein
MQTVAQKKLIFKNNKNLHSSDAGGQKSLIFKNYKYMLPSLEEADKNIY